MHSVGLNRPEMDKDLFSIPRHVLSPTLVPEWAGKDHFANDGGLVGHPFHPPTSTSSSSHPHNTHFPPSTAPLHTHRAAVATATGSTPVPPQHRLAPAVGDAPRHPPPAPRPYEPLPNSTHKRSKSFEDILNSPEFDPLNFHQTPIPPHSILPGAPQLENPPGGTQGTRVLSFDIFLEKGSVGLGFLVNQREGGEGGLVVQCLSPGGPAEL